MASVKLIEYGFGSYVKNATAKKGVSGTAILNGLNATAVVTEGLGYPNVVTSLTVINGSALAIDAASAVANDAYVQFSIGLEKGYKYKPTTLVMDISRGGAASPRGYVLRSSVDNYATNIATADLLTQRPTPNTETIDMSFLGEVDEAITFRLYVYSPGIAQSLDLNKLVINGDFTAVPNTTTSGINSIKDAIDAELEGKVNQYYFHKLPNQTTGQGIWFDLSSSGGMPVPQYYAATPLNATVMSFSSDRGIFHGYNVAPEKKYLRQATIQTVSPAIVPANFYLLDYLMYYPFIDEGSTDAQDMVNINTLSRYTDGVGVRVMAVSQGSRNGGQSFYFVYTNSEGVPGRISKTVIENTQAANGTIVSSAQAAATASGPFIPLQDGDKGVRSIEQVFMLGADVGLFALVLVKPLMQTTVREITAPNEKDLLYNSGALPEIQNDAYLNWICCPNGSVILGVIRGDLKVIWK